MSYAFELQGALEPADDLMGQAVQAGAGCPENTQWTRIQLGNLLRAQGRIDEAEAEFRHALAMIPNYARAEAGLGAVAVARGDLADAERWYQPAANHLPLPEIVIALGDVRAARGDDAGADDAYALVRAMETPLRAVRRQQRPGARPVRRRASRGPAPTRRASCSAPARRSPSGRPSTAHDALGWALYSAGRCDEALPEARAATALGTADPRIAYHLGAIAACAGDEATARTR